MIPGPDRVIACPACGALAKTSTLASGNTFGALFWTDGYMEAPMFPEEPPVTRCRACRSIYWRKDARPVDELSRGAEGPPAPRTAGASSMHEPSQAEEWKAAPYIEELSAHDCIEACTLGLARDREEEVLLRTLTMQRINDRWRYLESVEAGTPLPEAARRENLARLLDLLDEADPSERLLKAEAGRELGLFEEALRLLTFDFGPHLALACRLMRDLAQRGETEVAEITADGGKPRKHRKWKREPARQEVDVVAHNELCARVARTLQEMGLTCPRCGRHSKDIRHMNQVSQEPHYFICKNCCLSFDPEDVKPEER